MTLRFTVPGRPIGTNSAYKRSGMVNGRKGFYLTPEASAFKERLRVYAIQAAQKVGWQRHERRL